MANLPVIWLSASNPSNGSAPSFSTPAWTLWSTWPPMVTVATLTLRPLGRGGELLALGSLPSRTPDFTSNRLPYRWRDILGGVRRCRMVGCPRAAAEDGSREVMARPCSAIVTHGEYPYSQSNEHPRSSGPQRAERERALQRSRWILFADICSPIRLLCVFER
jgi:hypothetical protein